MRICGPGPKDPRLAKAVWRGSTGGFGGLEKGRAALLNLGLERPDLIDSGVLDWDYAKLGDDRGRLKEKMDFGAQVLSIGRVQPRQALHTTELGGLPCS
jgi:hypothetical protein